MSSTDSAESFNLPGFSQISQKKLIAATTDDYVQVMIMDVRALKDKYFVISNTHASNSLKFKIMGSVDINDNYNTQNENLVYDITAKAETTVAAAAKVAVTDSNVYTFWALYVKSDSAGNAASAQVYFTGRT